MDKEQILKHIKKFALYYATAIAYSVFGFTAAKMGLGLINIMILGAIMVTIQVYTMYDVHVKTWKEATNATVDKLAMHFRDKLQGELRGLIRRIMEEGMKAEDLQI